MLSAETAATGEAGRDGREVATFSALLQKARFCKRQRERVDIVRTRVTRSRGGKERRTLGTLMKGRLAGNASLKEGGGR